MKKLIITGDTKAVNRVQRRFMAIAKTHKLEVVVVEAESKEEAVEEKLAEKPLELVPEGVTNAPEVVTEEVVEVVETADNAEETKEVTEEVVADPVQEAPKEEKPKEEAPKEEAPKKVDRRLKANGGGNKNKKSNSKK